MENGITEDEALNRERINIFGENKFASPPMATYFELFMATFEAHETHISYYFFKVVFLTRMCCRTLCC